MDYTYFWLIAAVFLAGADILLGTVFLLIIGLAALAGFVVSLLGLGFALQAALFAVVGIAGCVIYSRVRHQKQRRVQFDAEHLQNVNEGQTVEVEHWDENGKAKVFYRGAVWDAVAASDQAEKKGLWEIVGMKGNTLVLKFVREL